MVSPREFLARLDLIALHTGSSENGGSGQRGGYQELSLKEHRRGEVRAVRGEKYWGTGREEVAVRRRAEGESLGHPDFLTVSRTPPHAISRADIFFF